MAITMNVLGGYATVPFNQSYIIVVEGLTDGTYFLCREVADPNNDATASTQETALTLGGGLVIYHVSLYSSDTVGGTHTFWLHDLSDPDGNYESITSRVPGAPSINLTWTNSPGSAPTYITTPPVLTVTAQPTYDQVDWSATGTLDLLSQGEVLYLVRRALGVAPPGDAIDPTIYVTALTRNDDDPSILAGNTYTYDVISFLYFARGDEGTPITPSALISDRIVGIQEGLATSNTDSCVALFGTGQTTPRQGGIFTSLCGVTSVATGDFIYLIGSGLIPGQNYHLMIQGGGPNDIDTGSNFDADAGGFGVFPLQFFGAQTHTYFLHVGADPAIAARIGGSIFAAWVSGGQHPSYGTPPVLTDASPGNTTVQLAWQPAMPCDPGYSSQVFQVRRSTVAPPPDPTVPVVSNLTNPDFLDTGRVNGTTYYYLIRATVRYVDDLISITLDSNILSARPSATGEYWGGVRGA